VVKNVFIIGMGRFGLSVAESFHEHGIQVTVVDIDEALLNSIQNIHDFHTALVLDTTNFEALASTAIKKADYVIVGMSSIEGSIMTCVNLRDLGIRNIVAKVKNKVHRRVMKTLGPKIIVFPEHNSAIQIVDQIMNEEYEIISKGTDYSFIKFVVKNPNIIGIKIEDLENIISSSKYKVIALKKNDLGQHLIFDFKNYILQKLDQLYILCSNDNLAEIKKKFILIK